MKIEEFQNIFSKKDRINVCGSPGSGKSTLAKKLSSFLELPVFDLDDMFYSTDCKRKSHSETIASMHNIFENEKFIIDGTYLSSFEDRLKNIDIVILIKQKNYICLYNFLKRLFIKNNLKCGEKLTFKTFLLILNFKKIEKEIYTMTALAKKLLIVYENASFRIVNL